LTALFVMALVVLLACVLALVSLAAVGEYEAAKLEFEREKEAIWDRWRDEVREP